MSVTSPQCATVYSFEDFRIDHRSGLCRQHAGRTWEPITLGSRAFEVLWVLLENSGALLSKRALMDMVWAGVTVEEANLTVQISALRRVLDKDRTEASCIQTVIRRGYRFLPAVTRHLDISIADVPVDLSEISETHITGLRRSGKLGFGAQGVSSVPGPTEVILEPGEQDARCNEVLCLKEETEYGTLFDALVAEYAPVGPTEEHLVEELACIIWRRRLQRKVRAGAHREKVRDDGTSHFQRNQICSVGLLPITGGADGQDQHLRQFGTLRLDLRGYPRDGMRAESAQLADASEDRAGHIGATGAQHARVDRNWKCRCKRLHQVATREPMPGISCEADDPVMPTRYEIHLDRKLERTLALLFRLRKLRREDVPETR